MRNSGSSPAIRGILFKWVADLLAKAGGIVSFPILARSVGAEGYGAYTQVHVLIGMALPFAALGLNGIMVRFFAARPWSALVRLRIARISMIVLLVSGACSLVVALTSSWLNHFFLGWPSGGRLFLWASPLVALGALQLMFYDVLRCRQRVASLSVWQMAEVLLTLLTLVIIVAAKGSLVALFQGLVAVKAALVGLVAWEVAQWKTEALPDRAAVDPAGLGRMVRFGLPVAVAGLGLWMMHLGDRLVIGHVLGAEALGRYGAAYTLSLALSSIIAPLNMLLYPRLMQAMASQQPECVAGEVLRLHRYVALLLMPGFVVFAWLTRPLLVLLGGTAFTIDQSLVLMLLAAVCIEQWNTVAHYALLCADEAVFSQNVWLGAGLVNMLGNCIAVPLAGLHGAAAVTLLTFIGLDAFIFRRALRWLPLGKLYRVDVTAKAFLASLIAGFISLSWAQAHAGWLLAQLAVFSVLYVVLLGFLGEFRRSDWERVRHAFATAN